MVVATERYKNSMITALHTGVLYDIFTQNKKLSTQLEVACR